MNTLRSSIDELQAEDLRFAGDEQLETDFGELERAADLLLAERARRLAEIDRRGSYRRDGCLSVSSWLAQRFRMAFSAAAAQVRVARALEEMPATRHALREGEIIRSALRVLVGAREGHLEGFAHAEATLVDAARTLSVRELHRAVAYWRQAADHRRAEEDAEWLFGLRRLHVSPTLDGMVRVDGDLDPETGQTLITASVRPARRRSLRGRGRHAHLSATPGRRSRRDLPAVAGRGGPARGRRRAPPRHGDRGPGGAGGQVGRPLRVRRRRSDLARDGAAVGLRRLGEQGHHPGKVRASGSGAPYPRGAGRPAPGRGDPGRALPVPGMRPPARMVRRAPRPALGRRRRDCIPESDPAVPATPPTGSPRVPGEHR